MRVDYSTSVDSSAETARSRAIRCLVRQPGGGGPLKEPLQPLDAHSKAPHSGQKDRFVWREDLIEMLSG